MAGVPDSDAAQLARVADPNLETPSGGSPPRWRRPSLDRLAALLAPVAWIALVLHRVVLGVGEGAGDADGGESMVGVLAHRMSLDGIWALWNWSGPGSTVFEAVPAASMVAFFGS